MENTKFKSGGLNSNASLQKETFEIGGMTCASCANSIEQSLSRLEGVHSVKGDLSSSSATLEYDPQTAGPDEMKTAVERIGYKFGVQNNSHTF